MLKKLNTLPCPICGGRDFDEHAVDITGGMVWERRVVCGRCDCHVNTWFAGHYEHPRTYTEKLKRWLLSKPCMQ